MGVYRPGLARLSALMVGLAACSLSDGGIGPAPVPTFLGTTVLPNPHNTISAVAEVRAALWDSAFVRFWKDGQLPVRSPSYAFGQDTVVRIPVLGLDTAAAYTIEVNLVLGDTLVVAADTGDFVSGTLPDWIPHAAAQGSDTTPGYLAISYPDGPVIVDNSGRVVWYRSSPNGVLNSFQAHANGQYTALALDDSTDGFLVLDELGYAIGALECQGYATRFHDLLVLADGSAWLLCDDTRTMDLSALGGVDTASVTGTVVQQLSPAGTVLSEWNVFDHFAITDLPPNARSGSDVNFTHGNGIALDGDGNLLLSFRSLNEITKINATTGEVMWRLGGLRNEFTFVNDPKGTFERQHGLRPAGPGQIQVLDNGLRAPSRFARYLLNPVARTALLVVEFIDAPTTYTLVGGGTQYYGNGHGLVSFGRAGRLVEFDEAGNRAWELTGIDGIYVFRAQRIASLYAAERAGR
ncbi:MAG: arylsulfotransferase family protein [Gemmatimonadota bacterium]|nr:arylsulfotransferase family protein [Gemmatimonadota bacterium]